MQYPRDSPRSAWELQKKIGAATNSRKNYKKYTKKTGGELSCKHFGVNGKQGKSLSFKPGLCNWSSLLSIKSGNASGSAAVPTKTSMLTSSESEVAFAAAMLV